MIEVGTAVVPPKAGPTAYPGKVVEIHADGTVDVCWRGTRNSIQLGVRPERLRAYVGRLPLYGPNRTGAL